MAEEMNLNPEELKEQSEDFFKPFLDDYKKVLVEAGKEFLKLYYQNECKQKITDIYMKSPKYKLEEDLVMYETYIREIGQADSVDKMLEIYMEAADIMTRESPVTPFSKKKK